LGSKSRQPPDSHRASLSYPLAFAVSGILQIARTDTQGIAHARDGTSKAHLRT
jgi:hypothetical protein